MTTVTARVGCAALLAAVLTLAGCASSPPPEPTTTAAASNASAALPVGPDATAVLTPIAARPLSPEIYPVLGADDRLHLAYELQIVNMSGGRVLLDSVAVLGDGDTALTTIPQADLRLRLAGGASGDAFGPGEAADLFLDVTLPADATPPQVVRHTFAVAMPDGATKNLTFTGVPVAVSDQQAVVVAPPLKGKGWVAGNGCCDAVTAHRGATLPVDGTIRVAQRFAIDFVQLDAAGQLYTGDPADNASFPFFGDEILSAADGTVVRVLDGEPNQPPGTLPAGANLQNADGNYVVVDIGNGRFAFYAHMQPGTVRVKVGDRVKTGDVLGILGNSGNTDAPHLHFHIMDGPSPLQSNGLPFVFTSFTGTGVVGDEAAIVAPFAPQAPVVPIDATTWAGPHRDQLPLNLQVVDFGS
ncbi:M23 family metallopeptidase [Pseudonocardia sp. WMMC193]|uniref:M23 family metallopeptidase n=1 Tax=Pseudonocardia sp. WMMC193 TaxID=2911965 RepID=UPI001F2A08B3|nr:M23 family metallopeptidase [Pseudonocardia sp. WMMC193]MCF7553536.1 M23 family metallopeptidase [Pseudonocardia sp. WMMC193]